MTREHDESKAGVAVTRLRARRLWIAGGWALVAAIVYLSLAPAAIDPGGAGEGDKTLHLVGYATLMAWFASIYEARDRRRRFAAGFVAMGITLELVQPLTGLRHFELVDLVANSAGVLIGWAIAPPRLPNPFWWLERPFRGGGS
jgi:hypothetical protein